MTKEQEKRIIGAMVETRRALDRAMTYSPQVRDQKLIISCEMHLEKLAGVLASATH